MSAPPEVRKADVRVDPAEIGRIDCLRHAAVDLLADHGAVREVPAVREQLEHRRALPAVTRVKTHRGQARRGGFRGFWPAVVGP